MLRRGRRRHRAGSWILPALAVLAAACEGKESAGPRASSAGPPASPGPGVAPPAGAASAAAAAATPTEEDLTRYVEWTRDWKLLTNRHKAELDAVTDQVAAKYSPQETDRVVQDPEYVACLERQGTEMKAHFAGQPRGRMASGFQAVLEGIGSLVPQPHGYVYVPGRNPEALDKARQVHGDAFVDWVLEREDVIVATLSQ